MKNFCIFMLFILSGNYLIAQEESGNRIDTLRSTIKERFEKMKPNYNADSVRAVIESGPYFTLYKDNYFVGGSSIGDRMTRVNSNIKFQISISQKITRSNLPFDTYLFIQYSQKTIWNVFEKSLPMHDLNFNPGIGLGHLFIHKNRFIGMGYLLIEHESNGKDDERSRSWNKITFGASLFLTKYFDVQLKTWIPIIDSENNKDILHYNGLAQVALCYRAPNKRMNASLITTWRSGSFSFNTQWELSYKINHNENQFLFLQYYNGYGENLLDYNKYQSNLRIGFVIKPQGFSVF